MSAGAEIVAGIVKAVAAIKNAAERKRAEIEIEKIGAEIVRLNSMIDNLISDSKSKEKYIAVLETKIQESRR